MKLYVGNLPFSMDEAQLRALFEEHGSVDSAAVITDRETGRSRGFGFVEMTDDGACRNAMQALDNHPVDGRNLKVNEARPRSSDGGGGRGGDRGGDRGGGRGGGRRW
ncbi:MAG: RNA-binding protein [bacterium]